MPVLWLFLIVLALAAIGFIAGRMRVTSAGGERPHSLPNYYGWNVAMKVMAPAFLALVVWLLVQPMLVDRQVTAGLAEGAVPEGSTLGLVMSDVRRVAGYYWPSAWAECCMCCLILWRATSGGWHPLLTSVTHWLLSPPATNPGG